MKKILSTTGAPIEFAITGDRKVIIDTVDPIEVSNEDFAIIDSRLGSQVSVVSEDVEETESAPEAEAAPSEEVPITNDQPILKEYKVLDEAGVSAPDGSTVAQSETVELDALDENTISLLTAGAIEEVTPIV